MRIAGLMSIGIALSGAAPHRFSFRAIEFEPRETRLPAAQAFLARVAAPGTPVAVAVRAIERADAACRTPRAADATIVCYSSRPSQRSDEDGLLDDITWTIRLRRGADGTVAAADVERRRYGS